MKIKLWHFVFFLSSYINLSFAQDTTRQKYISLEGGMTFHENEISNMDHIRGSIPSYEIGYSAYSITSTSYRSFVGIKGEIFSLNDRFGLLGGIRFSNVYSSIGKNDYWSNNPNYFYWLYRQDGINTQYLKLKEINQKSAYIGIPIEIRYFTQKRPRLFQLYVKLGIEINGLLQSSTDIVFENPDMKTYEKEMIATLKQPGRISAAIYGGAGFKIGRDQKPSISFEACMPYAFLTSKSSGVLQPIYGGGFQLNLQIPIKSKAK